MIKQILNKLGLCRKQRTEYREIEYSLTGTPDENTRNLLEAVTYGNDWIRERTQSDYEQIGAFFTVVLLVEHKLVDLLSRFDPQIENKMLGRKIDSFKAFLKAFEFPEKNGLDHYRSLIAPLRTLKKIRDEMAHDITRLKILPNDLRELSTCLAKYRTDFYENTKLAEDDHTKVFLIITFFGFYISEELARLRVEIK